MPIFEYRCDKCKSIQEKLVLHNDEAPSLCTCGGHLKRIVSRSSFHLKGTGWYVTDYKNRKDKNKNNNV